MSCFLWFIAGAADLLRRAVVRRREAFRPGTRANIRSHVTLYAAFACRFGLPDFPATESSLLAFAEFLVGSCRAPKSVLNALGSVKHFHLDHQLPVYAFGSRTVQLWRRALPRTLRHVPQTAPALRVTDLERLCGLGLRLGEEGVVMAALMAFAFASMARLSSLVSSSGRSFDSSRLPTVADVAFWEGIWQLKIKWAKAHQDPKDGFWVPLLPRPGSDACPVARWADLRRLRPHGSAAEPLFWCPGREGGLARRVRSAWP